MRIFILPGTHTCNNLGDVAMLQVAVTRLHSLWPDAVLHVLTGAPEKLKFHCPETVPVPLISCERWSHVGSLPRFFFPGLRPEVRRQFPGIWHHPHKLARLLDSSERHLMGQFVEAFFKTDLVVMSGCGMITDAFLPGALATLDLLETAIRCGIPTAMCGQGIGPIQNQVLFQRAARTLPHVGKIFVRERRASLDLLKKLGVPDEKNYFTGDDTVEMAFNETSSALDDHIGVNVRVADYSGLESGILEIVRATLVEKARRHQTSPVGISILCAGEFSDIQTLQDLIGGEKPDADLDTPLKIIRRISGCRVVIAGSYHAAVFALAQGIPVVGIVKSDYYAEKFHGLAAEFGAGCVVLRADDAAFSKKLGATVDELWEKAGGLKPELLSAAQRQINAAHEAWALLPGLLRR